MGQVTGTLTHKTHHGPDSGEATSFPHIVFSATLRGGYIQMALFPGTPKLESRNCPEIVPIRVPRLWVLITPDCRVWSRRGLNQSCSPCWDLSNAMLHSQFGGREEVDSWLLVVGSQTANLTPGPSFAHNLGCRCPNGQCEAIFDIYVSRTFQWHQEHPNARCFGPCCRTLNIWESRRTPSPNFGSVGLHPHTWPKWGCDRGTYHLPPYSILCTSSRGLHPNDFSLLGLLRLGSPEIAPTRTPATLESCNFVSRPQIEVRSKAKL
jgi:hypothetical protein